MEPPGSPFWSSAQIVAEAIEALVPEAAIGFDPVGDLGHRGRLELAGTPLGFLAA